MLHLSRRLWRLFLFADLSSANDRSRTISNAADCERHRFPRGR